MTKEEILDKHLEGSCCDRNDGGYIDQYGVYENIEDAMEEYAKQTAIEFLIWAEDNYSIPHEGFSVQTPRGEEPYIWDGTLTGTKITLSELYNLYLQQKS